jgi:hypothetical protein
MSIPVSALPQPAAHSIIDVMAFVDQGYYPFAQCSTCDDLMPMSVDHGIAGTVAAICCKCRVPAASSLLRFLSNAEATALGWRFELMGEKPPN